MKLPKENAPVAATPKLTPAMKTALGLLLEAHEIAAKLDHGQWDFALELHALTKEAGLSHNDLRLLICQGFTEHRVERTRAGAKRRAFRRPRGLRLLAESCFVLSGRGLSVARQLVAGDSAPPRSGHAGANAAAMIAVVPIWDPERRELRLGDVLVKRFRVPARNQETILGTFQEDGWPPRIDNPLSNKGETDALDRLHDAVRKLNRQANPVLRFRSDGHGHGVMWSLGDPTVPGSR